MKSMLTPRKVSGPVPARRAPIWNVQELFEEMLPGLWDADGGWFGGELNPSVDVSETDKAIEVKMDLPGITAQEVDIQLNHNILTITGRRDEKKEEKGKTYHRVERRVGSFARSLALPCEVIDDEAAAEFQDGVLTITLPKVESAQARKIRVKG